MRLSLNELSSRLTGVSIYGVGASWKTEPNECKISEELVTYLENQGLFYAGFEWEHPKACYDAADKIRARVNERMEELRRDMGAFNVMRDIRHDLRTFRDELRKQSLHEIESKTSMTNDQVSLFDSTLLKLRECVGAEIASLALACKFSVSEELNMWLHPK